MPSCRLFQRKVLPVLPWLFIFFRLRECVQNYVEKDCDSDIVPVYIDAVNIYRHSTVRLLNTPCSSATEVGVAIVTIIIAVCIVAYF